jgi:hypothetical protein
MKAIDRRLRQLETRLVQQDYARVPRTRMRIVVSHSGKPQGFGPAAKCKRMLFWDGGLMEIVHLDGYRGGLTEDDIEQFVKNFPVTC